MSLLLLYRIFPSFPHTRKKSCMSRKKTVLRKISIAGAGPGWAGAGRDRPGPGRNEGKGRVGTGRAGGTCVFLHKNVLRNMLACLLGAVCRGEKLVFCTGCYPEGIDFFPHYTGFFPRKKSGPLRENPVRSRCCQSHSQTSKKNSQGR